MKTNRILRLRTVGLLASALIWCSPAFSAVPPTTPALPEFEVEASMNAGAGRGELLLVNLQLDDGAAVPCIVDTGSPITLLDRSLEPRLGKRLGTQMFWNFGEKRKLNVFASPKLYLPRKEPSGKRLSAFFTECLWAGQTYTHLVVQQTPGRGPNLIGLRFLARHLVTLDFPNRTLYLQQTSAGPLANDFFVDLVQGGIAQPLRFLDALRGEAQLPGWPGRDPLPLFSVYHPEGDTNSYTAVFGKAGDPLLRHYSVARASKNSPWRLQERWETEFGRNP